MRGKKKCLLDWTNEMPEGDGKKHKSKTITTRGKKSLLLRPSGKLGGASLTITESATGSPNMVVLSPDQVTDLLEVLFEIREDYG